MGLLELLTRFQNVKTDYMTMYEQAKDLVDKLALNEKREIELPLEVHIFRKYISEMSYKAQKKIITRTKGNKLVVMRVEFIEL